MLRLAVLALLVALLAIGTVPTQAAPPASWPVEGSSVEYALRSSASAPDGSYSQVTTATLRLTYSAGAWHGTCSGATTTSTDVSTTETFEVATPAPPPMMPTRTHRGDAVDPALTAAQPVGCRQDEGTLVVDGHGDPGKAKTILAQEAVDASPYLDAAMAWDGRTGLVLSWSHAASGGGFEGRLTQRT